MHWRWLLHPAPRDDSSAGNSPITRSPDHPITLTPPRSEAWVDAWVMLVVWRSAAAYRGDTPPRGEDHPERAAGGQEAVMVMHPRDVRMINDRHRREILEFVTRERLAARACGQVRRTGSRPQRLPNLVLVVALLIAALVGLTALHTVSGAAQVDTPAAASGDRFVGAWRFTDLAFDLPSLATFTTDGNLFVSNLPVEAVPPEMDIRMLLLSPGHGAWEAASEDRANFTFVYLYVDETGTFQSAATLSGVLELANDGQALRGEYGFEVREPEGTVVHSYTGAIEGTRIGIVPMDEIAVAAPPAGVSAVLLPAPRRGPQ
ncbi:MAG: hypothetical protein ACRDJC_12990 [Thermomicrobiales bacterium]